MIKQPQSSRLVSAVYNVAYKTGMTPWDSGGRMPEVTALVEGPDALPPGRMVDLGCGRGGYAVYFAQHGWKVAGIDIAPEAIKLARRNADEHGVDIEFVRGDLLEEPARLVSGGPFDLLFDFGCAHSLRDEAKARYAAAIAGLAAPAATLILYAFTKGPLSVKPEEIDRDFTPHWELVSATPGSVRRTPDAGPMWYRMTRRA